MIENKLRQAERLLAEVEDDLTELKYSHNRAEKLEKASKIYKEVGKEEKAQKIGWDTHIFRIHAQNEKGRTADKKRFQPFPEELPKEAIQHYKNRVTKTSNPIHKARYCDFLWEWQVENAYKYAEQAVESYLNCAKIYLENEWYHDMADSILRSATVSRYLNNEQLQKETKNKALKLTEQLVAREDYRYCLELIEATLNVSETLSDEDLNYLENIAEEAAKFFYKEKQFRLRRSFLKLLLDIHNETGNNEKTKNTQELIVNSYISQAESNRDENPILEATFYRDALAAAQNYGLTNYIPQLKKQTKQAYEKARENLKKISTEIEVPMEKIDDRIDRLLEKPILEALEIIASDMSLIPSYAEAEKFSKKLDNEYISRQIFQEVNISKDGMFDTPISEHAQEEVRAKREFMFIIRMSLMIYLDRVFTRLSQEGDLDKEALLDYLSDWELIKTGDIKFLEKGIERYFAGDYISSIHILVPRLENMIRGMLANTSVDTAAYYHKYKREHTFMQDKTLNQIFELELVKQIFGTPLYHYFYTVLLESHGFNLRNNVAHGLIRKELCQKSVANLVLHLLLLLTCFHAKKN